MYGDKYFKIQGDDEIVYIEAADINEAKKQFSNAKLGPNKIHIMTLPDESLTWTELSDFPDEASFWLWYPL